MPGYLRQGCSNYSLDTLAHENSSLFFARPLVEQILETPGQELGTHTYSHFYCGEEGASPAQFAADLECAKAVAGDLGVVFKSLVFLRNQVLAQYLPMASAAGLQVYRGNFDHWLYREGHIVPGGVAGRAIRYADSWLPLSGTHAQEVSNEHGIANVPASLFLRPWSRSTVALEPLRLARLKAAMTDAAKQDKVCHLWWHPHNFAFTKYGNFNFAYDIGNWNVSLGYPSWFFIAPLLGPVYILYTLMLGFISFYLLKKIGISSLSIDMLWYAWLVYLMAPWLLTFTGFIYALLVFFCTQSNAFTYANISNVPE